MKDIRINNVLHRVFVLTETDERVVYIPLKHLSRVDYERLLKVEAEGGDMLTQMKKTRLDNGRNALSQYDSIIQVASKESDTKGNRLPKPDEPESIRLKHPRESPAPVASPEPTPQPIEKKPKQRRGRPPKKPVATEPETTG